VIAEDCLLIVKNINGQTKNLPHLTPLKPDKRKSRSTNK